MSSICTLAGLLCVCLVFCEGQSQWLDKKDRSQRHKNQDEVFTMHQNSDPAQPAGNPGSTGFPFHVNGIFPSLTATADSAPLRTECGTGALMPWADHLYMVSYLSVPNSGNGTGLYAINSQLQMVKLANHQSTYANRLLHKYSNQIVIGAWVIDRSGNVREFSDLLHVRVAATAEHLTQPKTKVYMLGMDGPLWECDVYKLNCTQLFDLVKELEIPAARGEQPHFKAAHTMAGRLVVTSNTFEQADFVRTERGGRLAEWLGPGTNWTILSHSPFVEVTGRANFGRAIYAVGWDDRSAILKVFVAGDDDAPSTHQYWQTYRLPKASHAYDHLWQTEWPRIREVETERYLMDAHGMFYELSPLGWAGSTFGIRPISQHLRMVPDFTSFRGMLVLGGNQVSSIFDNNIVTGQAQSGLWFGKTDDLWSFGKPRGWGAVWRRDEVLANIPSDPYLMTGFEHKVLHLQLHDDSKSSAVFVRVEVDITGTAGHIAGEDWLVYEVIRLRQGSFSPQEHYRNVVFPVGYSAHWVRVVSEQDATLTAYFHFT